MQLTTGQAMFEKIFGAHAKHYAERLEKQNPGMSKSAIYAPYVDFYAKASLLSLKKRLLVTIASLVSQNNQDLLPSYIQGAIHVGCTPVAISETILQMGIYVGRPYALQAMDIFHTVMVEKNIHIDDLYQDAQKTAPTLADADTVFRQLFGDNKAQDIYQALAVLSPQLSEFAITYPFGAFYAKSHLLDLQTRELITVASLVTQGLLPQLKLHIEAALHIGCQVDEIEQTILQLSAYCGNPKMLNALKELNTVKKAN